MPYSSIFFSQQFAFSQGRTWRETFAQQISNQPEKGIGKGVCMVMAMWWIDAKANDKPFIVNDTAALKKSELIANGTGDMPERCSQEMVQRHGLTRRARRDCDDNFDALKEYVAAMPSRFDLVCLGDPGGANHFFGVVKINGNQFRMFDPNYGEYKAITKYGVNQWLGQARQYYVVERKALSDQWTVVSFT